LFELPPLLLNAHNFSKMQGMDKKNDGHVWWKVITTNIKNSFGLSFQKTHYLGHLHCVRVDCGNFMHSDTFPTPWETQMGVPNWK
jgi:hypothetical protein